MSPAVGQVWQAAERLPGGIVRFVRIDEILTKTQTQTILGLSRTIESQVARVSTRPAPRQTWQRSNRTIRLNRFDGRFYRLKEGIA